jgi:membrane protein
MARRRGRLRAVSKEIYRRLIEHDLMMMAAAISFYWLLAFVPMLLLGTSAIGYLLGSSDQAVEEIMRAAARFIPRGTGPDVALFLRSLIQSRYVTGLVGLGFLLWFAMGLFEVITNSLTRLSGERETRSYLRRKLVALVLIGTVGFLFVAALVASWMFMAWANLEDLIGIRLGLPAILYDPSTPRYVTSLFMGVLLTVIYRVAPVRGVRWPWAIVGGTFAGMLWHLAKLLFNWYLVHYARYNLFYGILGGFVGLILWIFYTAIILLLGGILADVLDRNTRSASGG